MTKREFYDRLEQSAFIDSLDNCCRIETNLRNLIGEIFSDHEAQLKAKDDEIKALKKECEYDQRNASMSQKESVEHLAEIERLKAQRDGAIDVIKDNRQYIAKKCLELKHANAKARSMVAMLFWEWKKSQKWAGKNHFASKGNEDAFKKAYKMLKESK